MAWEAVSKEEVARLSGVKTTELRDEWYAMAVDLIGRIAHVYNIGTPVAVSETRNGTSSRIMPVYKPPIVSVQSVYIDDELVPASLIDFSDSAIYIKSSESIYVNNIDSDETFEYGSRNVIINYTSGSTSVDHSISLTIALVIKELAGTTVGEGAESRVQFYRPGQSDATEAPLTHWGIHGKIKGIITTLLGSKVRMI
jgi:hypothetical protein